MQPKTAQFAETMGALVLATPGQGGGARDVCDDSARGHQAGARKGADWPDSISEDTTESTLTPDTLEFVPVETGGLPGNVGGSALGADWPDSLSEDTTNVTLNPDALEFVPAETGGLPGNVGWAAWAGSHEGAHARQGPCGSICIAQEQGLGGKVDENDEEEEGAGVELDDRTRMIWMSVWGSARAGQQRDCSRWSSVSGLQKEETSEEEVDSVACSQLMELGDWIAGSCGFLRISGFSLRARASMRFESDHIRYRRKIMLEVQGLPWVRRKGWRVPLLCSIAGAVESRGLHAWMDGGQLFVSTTGFVVDPDLQFINVDVTSPAREPTAPEPRQYQ